MAPETRYAKSGDVNIAYQVWGDGPIDLVFVPGFVTHLEIEGSAPRFAPVLERLSSFSRLICFDKRGTGMSDRISGAPTLETRMTGDGFLAVFDGPARAIRCASAIVAGIPELGLEVRAGLHCGECELVDGKVAGIAVHIGARVAAHAGPGEVLVSSTVKDLVAGSGIAFIDRGTHVLKGVPDAWQLFQVAPAPAAG